MSKEKEKTLTAVDEFIENRTVKAELDTTFNAEVYIDTFNPTLTADGFKLEVVDYRGTLMNFHPINAYPIYTWNDITHHYSDDYHNITFCGFKGLKDSLMRLPENKWPIVLSHLYVVFKANAVFRYKSGAVQCHKATLYGLNPEGKGLIELGHSCFDNCKEE